MFHTRFANKITRVLIYAILEWTLISLLLLNSLFSLLILRFARYFGLKPPCILCSRLDKTKDSSFYAEIICEQHASDIAKLGYCSNHRKFVELQSMCPDCSPDVTHFRWMKKIGIVGVDEDDVGEVKRCSCCDAAINPLKIALMGSSLGNEIGDFVSNQRELMGSDSDLKIGYVALDNRDEEDEEEVVFEAEKQPLLNDIDDNKNEQYLCQDMHQQHMEFYIDHDDYRLIPVDLVNSLKVGKYDNSQDFELILEGDEFVPPWCGAVKNLPSIQEEDEQDEINPVEDLPPIDDHGEDDEAGNESRISQSWEKENKNEERKLLTLQEEDVEEKKFEEEKIERKFPTLQEKVVEEKLGEKIEREHEEEGLLQGQNGLLEGQQVVEEKLGEKIEREDQEEGLLQGQNGLLEGLQAVEEKLGEKIEREDEEEGLLQGQEGLLKGKEEEDKAIESIEVTSTLSESAEEDSASHLKSDDETDGERNEDDTGKIILQVEEPCKHEIPIITDNVVCEVSTRSVDENESAEEDTASHLKSDETDAESNEDDSGKILIQVEEHEITTITDNVVDEVFDEHDDKKIEDEVEARNCRSREHEITEPILNVDVGLCQNEVEEEKVPETPTSVESLHNLHKKLSLLGRRESATTEESLDGSLIGEIEGGGDAVVEKLKSDLQAERNALRAVYKELEAERNAAAVAANQTMAMITRLQEEKATMQMEALQYQRMMEEQSEYDQEALQMMNELMVKREKEKQDLEKELEVYRKKVVDYEEREKMRVLCRRMEHGSMRSRNSSASCSYGEEESDGLSVDLNHEAKDHEDQDNNTHFTPHDENGHQDTPTDAVLNLNDSLASFEEERHAILEQLKVLEEKLFTLAEEEVEHIDNMKPFDEFYEENGKEFELDGCENGFSHVNGNHQQERRINGSMPKRLLPLFDATELLEESPVPNGKEDGFDPLELHKSPTTKFELEKKRVAIEEEVDHVYERLHALEADREFLKHCIGSLRKGDKGLDLLQEILQHLRDLKNVELQVMKNMDHCASV